MVLKRFIPSEMDHTLELTWSAQQTARGGCLGAVEGRLTESMEERSGGGKRERRWRLRGQM